MPIYDYDCELCGQFEVEQKITEEKLDACPKCGSVVKRLIGRTSFSLLGVGWATDGYGKWLK